MLRICFMMIAMGLLAEPGLAASVNVITNGDFEQGNTGFTSAYDYLPGGQIGPAASYGITSNPRHIHYGAYSYGDHTPGGTLMLAYNGATSPITLWQQTVAVKPHSDYTFSFYGSSWYLSPWGNLRLYINGTAIGDSGSFPSSPGTWTQYTYAPWNAGTTTTATLRLVNIEYASSGNDPAIDDLAFTGPDPAASPIPLPAAIALALPMSFILIRRK